MPILTQKDASKFGLGKISSEIYFTAFSDAARESARQPALRGQLHHIRKAFDALKIDGVLCVEGRPTVFFKDFRQPLTRVEINDEQRRCWNQGVATLLVLRDPHRVYLFSGLVPPNRDAREAITDHEALICDFEWTAEVLSQQQLVESISSGHFYRKNQVKFFEEARTVDHFLVKMLGDLASKLNTSGRREDLKHVHAFLARLVFACYLIDRGIIHLSDYGFIKKKGIHKLLHLLESYTSEEAIDLLFEKLFRKLKSEFNGSTFEGDTEEERRIIGPGQIDLLRRFFKGEDSDQKEFGFWAFDFSVIPVETISAIYEKFLESEDVRGKNDKGAFYTPRHLAELVVAETVDECPSLLGKRFLDPSCGSGIFLVILFNRLAEEWMIRNSGASIAEQIQELPKLLVNLRGVDVNVTACRITCFSLYIALLDQFQPRDLNRLKTEAGLGKRKPLLPELLVSKGKRASSVEFPTVVEGNYFDSKLPLDGKFDFIVGNPPWVSRKKTDIHVTSWMKSDSCPVKGKSAALSQDQIALAFLWKVPGDLMLNGTASLLLPSQLILNKTDDFQAEWFRRFAVSRLLHLADFRHFLFENAIRPCFVLRFHGEEPTSDEIIEYIVPKVTRSDPRTGLISAKAEDRKFLRLSDLLTSASQGEASLIWKTQLWGTYSDLKLIEALSNFQRLGDHAGTPKQRKRWVKRQGFQPWFQAGYEQAPETYGDPKPIDGSLDDPFIKTKELPEFVLLPQECTTLRKRLENLVCKEPKDAPREQRKASLNGFRRSPQGAFTPPMVLVNKGFTRFAFVDFKIFYQHSLIGIHGPSSDSDILLFLVVYLRSKLARYFLFHTASSLATERPEVQVYELLRLPFPIPGVEGFGDKEPELILKAVTSKVRATRKKLEDLLNKRISGQLRLNDQDFPQLRAELTSRLDNELDSFVYKYFGLSEDEVVIVEDTIKINDESDTPAHPYKSIPTLKQTADNDREAFAETLCATLNHWAKIGLPKGKSPRNYFAAEHAVLSESGLVLMLLKRSPNKVSPKRMSITRKLREAVEKVMEESHSERGAFSYRRNIIHFASDVIYIIRPDLLGQWTRTAALNTAEAIYGSIAMAKIDPNRK